MLSKKSEERSQNTEEGQTRGDMAVLLRNLRRNGRPRRQSFLPRRRLRSPAALLRISPVNGAGARVEDEVPDPIWRAAPGTVRPWSKRLAEVL